MRVHASVASWLSGLLLAVPISSAAVPSCGLPSDALSGVDAKAVVAIADGDFLASTYSDGELAPPSDERFRDRLLLWREGSADWVEVGVSNSVTSPPEVLAVSPDGRYAYVVERMGQRSPGDRHMRALAPGGRVTAVELDAPSGARVASEIELGSPPESIDLRPDGRMIAVVSNVGGRNWLHLVQVDAGALGTAYSFDLADLGMAADTNAPSPLAVSGVYWHPDGNALAITAYTHHRILFLRVAGSDALPRVTSWGGPVATGKDPFVGRFTPDGRHFISLDWGRNLAAGTLEERLPITPSRLSVIRLASSEAPDAMHRRVGGIETDLSSEGIAISPDGDLVAVISMRGTVLPPASKRHTTTGSVVLFRFDRREGTLRRMGAREVAGILPEGAAFDRRGRSLLVSVFQRWDCPGGALLVYPIESSGTLGRPKAMPTPHGIHHVVVR